MIGQNIAHYKIIDKLGAGGMGEVFLAEDTKLERKVALKFLPPHFSADPEFKSRFQHEAKATAALDHPNIVTIYELGEHEGRLYIAMQHVEGQTLAQRISTQTLTIPHAIDIVGQLCEGLASAHQAGIVHRDIKPANILIDPYGRVRILDFGLAKSHRATTETKVGSTLGTVQYESPEQSRGEVVDQRSDLFSVGVVLYEMITGKLPFTGDYDEAIRYSISHEAPEPIARFKSGTSNELQRIVSKLLEKDTSVRYQSAEGTLSDLRKLTISDAKHSDLPSVQRKSNWVLQVATIVTVLAIVIAGIKYWPSDMESQTPRGGRAKKSLAVLPFENLGSADDEYFADGITDEITSRLAMVQGLRVISRTSAMKFKQTDKTLPEIGAELGVEYILEGTIRWDKSGDTDRIRITPQLIKVSDDFHIWADNIERPLTQIFEVQSDIASNIVNALGVALLDRESRALTNKPTDNLEAYDHYLRANEFFDQTRSGESPKGLILACQLYQNALDADSDFIGARAMLARSYIELFWHFSSDSADLRSALKHIDNLRETAPESAEALITLGSLYYHQGKYNKALEEFTHARKIQPNNADLMMEIAFVRRRQGEAEQSLSDIESALEINPLSVNNVHEAGFAALVLHQYDKAERYLNKAINLGPDISGTYGDRAFLHIMRDGDTAQASKVIQDGLEFSNPSESFLAAAGMVELLSHNYRSAVGLFEEADFFVFPAIKYLGRAVAYEQLGEIELELIMYDSARTLLENDLETAPNISLYHSALGMVYARLGDSEAALRNGKLGLKLLGSEFMREKSISEMARIYVLLENYDEALDQLERILTVPSSHVSAHTLRLNPYWFKIHDQPRFEKLIEDFEKAYP